jgi:AbrB family looped-hinge helix DNA binding protein
MPTATITSKGQVTVPKEVRALFHLGAGKKIDFRIDESSGFGNHCPHKQDGKGSVWSAAAASALAPRQC